MYIVHVFIHVKPDFLDAFRQATLENASNSVLEPGIARFNVIQQQDDPTRFVLIEVYRQEQDTLRHRETAHYAAWRDAVVEMLVDPRTRLVYHNVFPEDAGWD